MFVLHKIDVFNRFRGKGYQRNCWKPWIRTCVSKEVYTARRKVYLLTLSWQRPLSYRNQSIDLLLKRLMEMSIGGTKCIRLLFYFCYSGDNLCSSSPDNYVAVDFDGNQRTPVTNVRIVLFRFCLCSFFFLNEMFNVFIWGMLGRSNVYDGFINDFIKKEFQKLKSFSLNLLYQKRVNLFRIEFYVLPRIGEDHVTY